MLDPILLDIPDAFESERLLIRVPRTGDGAVMNAAVIESLESLRTWMPWAQQAPTLQDSELFCRKAHGRFVLREEIVLHLYLRDGTTFVGSSGLKYIDWAIGKFEIGYWIRSGHEGRGYAVEAVRAIAAFALERLPVQRLEIHCDARNQRSVRVAEKAGFTLEALRRNNAVDVSGKPCDMLVYLQVPKE